MRQFEMSIWILLLIPLGAYIYCLWLIYKRIDVKTGIELYIKNGTVYGNPDLVT